MRRLSLSLAWATIFPLFATLAGSLPLTANELGLMLRSGYSSKSVEHELTQRHFVGSLDLKQEELLLKAGASDDLIAEINRGAFSLSAVESAKAQQQISALKNRKVLAAENAKRADAHYQQQLQKERASAASELQGANAARDFLSGSLLRCQNGSIVPADNDALEKKKLILFYFSAHWCGPCRQFTPRLVEYYKRVVAAHPEVELVFYSLDRSTAEMENYMRETGMPWLAIDYNKRQEKQNLLHTAGGSIPALFLLERTGRLLSNAVVEGKYIGPDKVLTDLDAILAGQGTQVAQAH